MRLSLNTKLGFFDLQFSYHAACEEVFSLLVALVITYLAIARGNEYFLYLVNLAKIREPRYEPMIVRNPTVDVLESEDWEKTVDKYHILKSS